MWSVKLDFDVDADIDTLSGWEESLSAIDGSITPIVDNDPDEGVVTTSYNRIEVDAQLAADSPIEAAQVVNDFASRVVGSVPTSVIVVTDEERKRSFPDW